MAGGVGPVRHAGLSSRLRVRELVELVEPRDELLFSLFVLVIGQVAPSNRLKRWQSCLLMVSGVSRVSSVGLDGPWSPGSMFHAPMGSVTSFGGRVER